jgi:hypothetical protein
MTITATLQLGAPVEQRGVVIAPLFPRRRPAVAYVTLEEALPLGFRVTEVDAAGSVPELLVSNPTRHNVLLYDGEELVGAKQNRILNVTVLVPAERTVRVPVSCVEQGRWSARVGLLRRRAAYGLPGAAPAQGRAAARGAAGAGHRPGGRLAGGLGQERAPGDVLADRRPG